MLILAARILPLFPELGKHQRRNRDQHQQEGPNSDSDAPDQAPPRPNPDAPDQAPAPPNQAAGLLNRTGTDKYHLPASNTRWTQQTTGRWTGEEQQPGRQRARGSREEGSTATEAADGDQRGSVLYARAGLNPASAMENSQETERASPHTWTPCRTGGARCNSCGARTKQQPPEPGSCEGTSRLVRGAGPGHSLALLLPASVGKHPTFVACVRCHTTASTVGPLAHACTGLPTESKTAGIRRLTVGKHPHSRGGSERLYLPGSPVGGGWPGWRKP